MQDLVASETVADLLESKAVDMGVAEKPLTDEAQSIIDGIVADIKKQEEQTPKKSIVDLFARRQLVTERIFNALYRINALEPMLLKTYIEGLFAYTRGKNPTPDHKTRMQAADRIMAMMTNGMGGGGEGSSPVQVNINLGSLRAGLIEDGMTIDATEYTDTASEE